MKGREPALRHHHNAERGRRNDRVVETWHGRRRVHIEFSRR